MNLKSKENKKDSLENQVCINYQYIFINFKHNFSNQACSLDGMDMNYEF